MEFNLRYIGEDGNYPEPKVSSVEEQIEQYFKDLSDTALAQVIDPSQLAGFNMATTLEEIRYRGHDDEAQNALGIKEVSDDDPYDQPSEEDDAYYWAMRAPKYALTNEQHRILAARDPYYVFPTNYRDED